MKTLRIAFLLVLFVGCASTPKKLSGKYGLVFGDDLHVNDSIVRALRDQLSSVDVVASPADDKYDAVIVLENPRLSMGIVNSYPVPEQRLDLIRRDPRVFNTRTAWLVRYEIVRRGTTVAGGTIAPEPYLLPDIAQETVRDPNSTVREQEFRVSHDIAQYIVRALTTRPAAQTP